jgi:5-bromo-4-chloroindolyl phosphate hydrolysis protein
VKNDLNWIIAGVAAAVLLPLLTVIGLPFIVAAIVAIIAFVGLTFFLQPRKPFEGLDVNALGRDKVAFATDLLKEAQPAADRLSAAAIGITDKAMKDKVRHLEQIARDVFGKVEANPGAAAGIRRFLSYYLPRAAEVSEGYAALEDKRAPDTTKLKEVGDVIGKLEDAFVHYADSLVDNELGSLDIDLKLIQQSLKEDLGR